MRRKKNQRCILSELPLSVSSSFVQGLSVSIQPLKALLSSVRSTDPCSLFSWQTKLSDGRPRCKGLLNGSGNSFSGHSQTLQSRKRHIPSSVQKGQSHHSLAYQMNQVHKFPQGKHKVTALLNHYHMRKHNVTWNFESLQIYISTEFVSLLDS